VPLLAAQRVAEADKAAAAEMREALFPEATRVPRRSLGDILAVSRQALFPEAEDGGGVMGRDPNAPLGETPPARCLSTPRGCGCTHRQLWAGESAPLGALLVQQLCSSDTIVKRARGDLVL